jgi:hypothetical protein
VSGSLRAKSTLLSAAESPALRFNFARETALFGMTARLAGSQDYSPELLASGNLRTHRALAFYRVVPKVRMSFSPPRSLQCRESALYLFEHLRYFFLISSSLGGVDFVCESRYF